jgi:hypothetical protein
MTGRAEDAFPGGEGQFAPTEPPSVESLHIQQSDAPWDHGPQRPTSNTQRPSFNHGSRWTLDVECWTFDVRLRSMERLDPQPLWGVNGGHEPRPVTESPDPRGSGRTRPPRGSGRAPHGPSHRAAPHSGALRTRSCATFMESLHARRSGAHGGHEPVRTVRCPGFSRLGCRHPKGWTPYGRFMRRAASCVSFERRPAVARSPMPACAS